MIRRSIAVLSLMCLLGILTVAGRLLFAAERRPARPPVNIEDPKPGDPTRGPIVAVLDTGVDVRHPALKTHCLPGINVAEPDKSCDDAAGHGTAIAGLIASDDDEAQFRGICPGARILPIKVTPGDSRETLPSMLAMGIEKALEAKASVICIAMGASRSSEALDAAIERAKKEGVLIVAAAGIGSGAADLWPAMHPWVVSCTVSELKLARLPGKKEEVMADYPAERAHISGKTELIGNGYSPALSPGGGHSTLQGSSVPCAKAAGVAALLRLTFPDATADQLRRLLTLSGAALETPNIWYHWPARRFSAESATAADAKDATDLALTYVDINPGPLEPDKAGKLEFTVANLGFAPADGDVSFDDGDTISVKGHFDAVPPGETRVVTVDLPALKEALYPGTARLTCARDKNAANDVLNVRLAVMKMDKPAVQILRPRLLRLRVNDRKAVVQFDVQNARDVEFAGDAVAEVKTLDVREVLKFSGRETRTVNIELDLPELAEGKTEYGFAVGVLRGEETICSEDFSLSYDEVPARAQYADAWATKEVIIDAPAFLLEGRESIPFLLFAPEVHTSIESIQDPPRGTISKTTPDRGLWLYSFTLEEVTEDVARTTTFDWRSPPPANIGGKILLHVEGSEQRKEVLLERTQKSHPGIIAESAVGKTMLALEDLIQFITEDGWSSVVNIPVAAFAGNAEPYVYVRGAAKYLDNARNPWVGAWTHFDCGPTPYQTMLRIRLHAALPVLDKGGQYYDIHVHTQCEFSRDAVEPRLAFGGPMWMLVRSAYAMGFIDRDYVDAVRAQDLATVAKREVIFTTDHNCFLFKGDKPAALPFRSGEDEITTLRRFFGNGANQEVGMADPKGRPLGAPHALTYGVAPRAGPWHGGRQWRDGIKTAGKVLEALESLDKWDLAEKTVSFLLKTLSQNESLRGKMLGKLNDSLKSKGVAEISGDAFKKICDTWAGLSENDLKETVELADRVLSAAGLRPEANENSAVAMESDLARSGTFIAAHPMVPQLNWDLDELDRAANLVGGPFPAVEVAQRFPFAGIQSWNEEPLYKCALVEPDQLRAFNPWSAAAFKANETWHCEWALGFLHYENHLAKPGMMFTFEPKEDRRKYFIRKLYHYAGSDAHGAFNYTTGVGATVLTKREVIPIAAAFGMSHGTETSSSHFGCARVYAQKPAFEEVYHGRVVCTDGPLLWFDVDSDVKFDGKALVWHESWEAPSQGQDVDGEIGGDGTFDGRRTALVRRDCDGMVVRYRVAEGGPLAPAVQRVDLFRVALSDEQAPKEMEHVGNVMVPKAQSSWRPEKGQGVQYRALKPWAPSGPAMLMVGGFSLWDEQADFRYDLKTKRCLTNPVWLSTVLIGASARPVLEDGKAFIPKGGFVATFRADHSMKEVAPTVLAKQFNSMGDSVVATFRLVPVPTEDGLWRPEQREIGGKKVEVDDSVLIAVNDQSIPLGPPWFPREGVDTFAVILAGAQDMHGNPYNAVAWKIDVSVPAGTVILPDAGDNSDGGGNKVGTGARKEDTASVCVKSGEEVQLPKGATCGGKNIPPGAWSVPDLPEGGLSLLVTCGAQTFTILLTSRATPQPFLDRSSRGFYGSAPAPGQGPATVSLKNRAQKTVESCDPLFVGGGTCVFSAPEAEPGACDVTVTQGDASKTVSLEAVAAKVAWDSTDAQPGETRVLRLVLEGASSPADWRVSGTIDISNGQVLSVTDQAHEKILGVSIALTDLPGALSDLAQVQALQTGKMTAAARLRAVKAGGK